MASRPRKRAFSDSPSNDEQQPNKKQWRPHQDHYRSGEPPPTLLDFAPPSTWHSRVRRREAPTPILVLESLLSSPLPRTEPPYDPNFGANV